MLHVAIIMRLHLYITSSLKFLQRVRFSGVLYSSLVFRDRRVAIRASGLGIRKSNYKILLPGLGLAKLYRVMSSPGRVCKAAFR